MRAVRFSAELGFAIEKETMDAVVKYVPRLEKIAAERIRDEFTKILKSCSLKYFSNVFYLWWNGV